MDDGKVKYDLNSKNVYLISILSRVSYELEVTMSQYKYLEKYNVIVKEELTQTEQQREKLYSSNENLDEKNGCKET